MEHGEKREKRDVIPGFRISASADSGMTDRGWKAAPTDLVLGFGDVSLLRLVP